VTFYDWVRASSDASRPEGGQRPVQQ
jgi:hypothetical protein